MSGAYLSSYFLDPQYVHVLNKMTIHKSRSESGQREILSLSPGANLEKLVLARNFDIRAIPATDQTRQALANLVEFEADLL